MADYRLYILDANDHIGRAIELAAEDDSEAIALARDRLDGEAAELWNLGRKVRRFRAEATIGSRHSGSPDEGASL
jgi:hypothetical protein